MTVTRPPLERLRKRADFLAAAKGHACAKGAVLVQARDRNDGTEAIRVGFTAARQIIPTLGKTGCDYVLIARGGAVARPWPRLLDDVKSALIRLAADLAARKGVPGLGADPGSSPPPAQSPA